MSILKQVVIIDDQDHALKQTMFEFPEISKSHIVFRHFDTIRAFRDARLGRVYLVVLDFFLLICFSSKKPMSDSMYRTALEVDRNRIGNVYSVQKIKESYANSELKDVLNGIFEAEERTGGEMSRGP
jgi:hypothetical protein